MRKSIYAVSFKNRLLKAYYPGSFANGMKRTLLFSNNEWLSFSSVDETQQYLNRIRNDLDDWINRDIPEQAKRWSPNLVDEFIKESQEQYQKMKRNIDKFKVVRVKLQIEKA